MKSKEENEIQIECSETKLNAMKQRNVNENEIKIESREMRSKEKEWWKAKGQNWKQGQCYYLEL